MLRGSRLVRSGGLLDKLVPGWQEKLWANTPVEWKRRMINYQNSAFEKSVEKHKLFHKYFLWYKEFEVKMTPSNIFRKPSVDWRRQLARGTLHVGRPQEGPHGSDYRPGNTFDRLKLLVPFTREEWAERAKHRSWDGLKLGLGIWAVWLGYRVREDYPVVWC